ncbi:MAG: hypothetical protein OCD02_13975 [Spirochaetaceae bacterium]
MLNVTKKIIVAAYEPKFANDIGKQKIVYYTDKLEDVLTIYGDAIDKNELMCIKVDTDKNLSELEFKDEWQSIPIALYTPSVGDLSEMLIQGKKLKKFNIQIFLPIENKDTIRDLRILSSVGINCGFYIKDENSDVDWEQVDDLFYYYAYTNTEKGNIEPFRYIIEKDYREKSFDFRAVIFDDPNKFVYVDKDFNYSVNLDELTKGSFLGNGIDELKSYINEEIDYVSKKSDMFSKNEICSYCSSWRFCRSNYFSQCQKNETYKMLFDSVSDYLEVRVKQPSQNVEKKWQL